MSQSTLPEQLPETTAEQRLTPPPMTSSDLSYELDYQPMPLTAPLALFLGIASFSAMLGLFGLVLAVVGILVSMGSWVQIRASQGRLSGTKLAIIGGILSVVFLGWGTSSMMADYKAELPPGFTRINFPREIAEKGFIVADGKRELHPDVKPLVDQPLFLKGYIWQSQTYENNFVLLKDDGKCCFGGNPAPNDMILVVLEDGQPFHYISGLVAVAGTLRADPDAPMGQPVYVLEAKHVAKAKTVF